MWLGYYEQYLTGKLVLISVKLFEPFSDKFVEPYSNEFVVRVGKRLMPIKMSG